jgi:hypothetical protein
MNFEFCWNVNKLKYWSTKETKQFEIMRCELIPDIPKASVPRFFLISFWIWSHIDLRAVPPPQKKVKKGAQLAGRGPWHAGIPNCFKNEDFFAENFWKKVVLRKISGTFLFEKITSTSSPPPPFLDSGIIFFGGGPGMERAQILEYTPPNRKPVGTALIDLPSLTIQIPAKFEIILKSTVGDILYIISFKLAKLNLHRKLLRTLKLSEKFCNKGQVKLSLSLSASSTCSYQIQHNCSISHFVFLSNYRIQYVFLSNITHATISHLWKQWLRVAQ